MKLRLPFFLASRFVADETLEGTVPVVRDLNRKGLRVALDLLGEHVEKRAVAEEARDTYIGLVEKIAQERKEGHLSPAGVNGRSPVNISIKLSMMGQMVDEDFCLENLLQLLEVAKEHGIFVRLDMEGSDLTASTLSIFERAYEEYPQHVGPVLQAMLKRTAQDVERMCELGASVRLCKGAYKEPPAIAYQNMDAIRTQFVKYMKRLVADAGYAGIATHDDALIEATKQFARENDIPRDAFEFQMLYGLRSETQEQMVRDGYNMLVYVPYGTEWVPYFWRRLRERKENVTFLLKNVLRR